MPEDELLDEQQETVDEWKAEAGKWKELATEHEKTATESAAAVQRLAELEKSTKDQADEHAEKLKATQAEAAAAAKAADERGQRTADEWRVEAEKWKQLSQKNEQLAKQNLAAVKRLEKLEADKATTTTAADKAKAEAEKIAAETKADLEAKATQAELRATRLAVAQELQVPTALVGLLSGDSKREIEQSADRLLRELANNKQPEVQAAAQAAAQAAVESQQKAKEDDELAQARKLLAQAEIKALRLEVATEKQLPSGLAEMLNANTREELAGQADALLAAIGGAKAAERSTRARMPTERLRSGALPEGASDSDIDPGKLADSILRRNRGY
jgi:hypothetical protein